jgi:hypothetical protein
VNVRGLALYAADVVTGGTSLAPDSATLTSAPRAAPAVTTPMATIAAAKAGLLNVRIASSWVIKFAGQIVQVRTGEMLPLPAPGRLGYPPDAGDCDRQTPVAAG